MHPVLSPSKIFWIVIQKFQNSVCSTMNKKLKDMHTKDACKEKKERRCICKAASPAQLAVWFSTGFSHKVVREARRKPSLVPINCCYYNLSIWPVCHVKFARSCQVRHGRTTRGHSGEMLLQGLPSDPL